MELQSMQCLCNNCSMELTVSWHSCIILNKYGFFFINIIILEKRLCYDVIVVISVENVSFWYIISQ